MATIKQNRDFIEVIIMTDLLDEAIDWIQSNLGPEDVFSELDLKNWAIENGFIKDENN